MSNQKFSASMSAAYKAGAAFAKRDAYMMNARLSGACKESWVRLARDICWHGVFMIRQAREAERYEKHLERLGVSP